MSLKIIVNNPPHGWLKCTTMPSQISERISQIAKLKEQLTAFDGKTGIPNLTDFIAKIMHLSYVKPFGVDGDSHF